MRITYTIVLIFLNCVFKCNIEYLICVLVAFFKTASLHGVNTMLLLLIREAVWCTLHRSYTCSNLDKEYDKSQWEKAESQTFPLMIHTSTE